MIDIHTHILPGVDDGSQDMEQTIEILNEAKKYGVTDIIFSSHFSERYKDSLAERRKIFKRVKPQADEIGVNIYLGNEMFIASDLMEQIQKKKACSLNDSRYVLFEFPLHDKRLDMIEVINSIKMAGKVPILAHPERYRYFNDMPEIFNDFVDMGVLLQCNIGSLVGQYGSKAEIISRKLLKCGLVSFLATDTHRPDVVYPNLPEIYKKIKGMIGEEELKKLIEDNPRKVIEDQEIERPQNVEIAKFTFMEKIQMKKP